MSSLRIRKRFVGWPKNTILKSRKTVSRPMNKRKNSNNARVYSSFRNSLKNISKNNCSKPRKVKMSDFHISRKEDLRSKRLRSSNSAIRPPNEMLLRKQQKKKVSVRTFWKLLVYRFTRTAILELIVFVKG